MFDIVIDLGCFSDTTRKIRAAAGQKVWDTRALKPGAYVYQMTSGTKSLTGKLVIVK